MATVHEGHSLEVMKKRLPLDHALGELYSVPLRISRFSGVTLRSNPVTVRNERYEERRVYTPSLVSKATGDEKTMFDLPGHTALKRLPFNLRIRVNLFRVLGVIFIPPVLFIRPHLDETALGGFLEQIGVLLIIACVLGRCWAMLYIGGNKNDTLVTTGPYSLCRNPLYVFSVMGVVGFGCMLQSLIYTVVLTLITSGILLQAATKEEGYLADKFVEDYVAYRNSTPRFMPVNFRTFQTEPVVNVNVRSLTRCFWDAAFFILAIPTLELVEWFHEINAIATFVLF